MPMFGRTKHLRSDVSLVTEVIQQLMLSRAASGIPVPYDELPITQGLVNLTADAVADMDLYAVTADGKPAGQTFAVLEQPNPDEDRADTIHKIVQSMMWTGNANALNGPRDTSGAVDAINVLNPNRVGHIADPRDDLRVLTWHVDGRPYQRDALTHWKINDDPRRGPLGRSPLRVCQSALSMYGWAYRYLADYFELGGNPAAVFKSKLNLDNTKITELVDEWIAARQQHRPPFMPEWLDLDVPATTQEISQVIEVLDFASAEICRLASFPPSILNAPTRGSSLTYRTTQEEFDRWLRLGLGTQWVRRIERGFTTLLPRGLRAHLDPSSLFPADLEVEPLGPDPTPTPAAAQPAAAQAVPA